MQASWSSNGSSHAYSHNRQVEQVGDSYVVTFTEGESKIRQAYSTCQERVACEVW